ncbi:lipocalin-like domain-containing protein [Methanocella arvoryzae]|nr:lipocalin family protein [Methanocella arvoryzae]
MKSSIILAAGVLLVSLLVCGCVGAGAILPVLNNEASGNPAASADPVMANDPIVGTWEMVNPVVKDGGNTLDLTDARWIFEADGTYEYRPLNAGIFKTTGTWTSLGTGSYEVVCGKDSRVIHYDLTESLLQTAEDERYLLARAA